jgi:hypothetical protein
VSTRLRASFWLLLAACACAPPCVDDGFMSMQLDPLCSAVTETSSTTGEMTATTTDVTMTATTTESTTTDVTMTATTTDVTMTDPTMGGVCGDGQLDAGEQCGLRRRRRSCS